LMLWKYGIVRFRLPSGEGCNYDGNTRQIKPFR
jgi:hypothetical protein